ncbi:hypothetical protein PRO82_000649 [Candidatus Protochlamydia amoebophila]|nr:hypothetical protein [Candidatus Protochlamydia amoebophila]
MKKGLFSVRKFCFLEQKLRGQNERDRENQTVLSR